ncbi:MAG: DapH/DapD/GlmU-related protein [Thermodesulfovibrionales bacterium]|nr:DapH/DapD/GlmU-related protein [Thermodesulfovibrionales bacterium]
MISKTALIHKNVVLGQNCIIEDFVIIGAPPHGHGDGELKTVIGDNALIRSHTVIYAGNRIGKNFQTGNKTNIRELNEIGDNVSIGTLSVVEHHVKIGNGVRIHTQAFIPEFSVLDDECWIGPNVVLTNARFPQSPDVTSELRGPVIRRKAKIGANATILPGVEVGENSLVGAGSVVTRDVPEHHIVAGNPAIILKKIHY